MDVRSASTRLTYAPARGIEVLARRAYGNSNLLNFRRQGCNARKRHVEETVVDLVGQNDDLVFEADIGNLLQFLLVEHLADRVVLCTHVREFLAFPRVSNEEEKRSR